MSNYLLPSGSTGACRGVYKHTSTLSRNPTATRRAGVTWGVSRAAGGPWEESLERREQQRTPGRKSETGGIQGERAHTGFLLSLGAPACRLARVRSRALLSSARLSLCLLACALALAFALALALCCTPLRLPLPLCHLRRQLSRVLDTHSSKHIWTQHALSVDVASSRGECRFVPTNPFPPHPRTLARAQCPHPQQPHCPATTRRCVLDSPRQRHTLHQMLSARNRSDHGRRRASIMTAVPPLKFAPRSVAVFR